MLLACECQAKCGDEGTPGFTPPLPCSRGAAYLHQWLPVSPVPMPGSRRWIGDKEAPRAEIAIAGPSGALIHERGASTVPLKNVHGLIPSPGNY